MAVFNPAIPDQPDPNYLGLSKPISNVEGSKVAEIGLKGASNLLDQGVKVTDQIIKDSIDKKIYSEVDAERDAYTQALQDTLTPVGHTPGQPSLAARAAGMGAGATGMDLLPKEEGPGMPTDLQNLPRTIGALHGGYSNGKISNTYYIG